jgi:cytochrome bd-type quinol oxidase subunit 1
MITLSEKSKRAFVLISDTALGLLFVLMVAGFFLDRSGLEKQFARQIIVAAVILALVATPIRLLTLALLFTRESHQRIARMSLSLIVILLLGVLLKWYFL